MWAQFSIFSIKNFLFFPFLFLHQIQAQLNKALDDMSTSVCTLKEGMSYTKQLPSKGLSQSQVLDEIREYETLSKSWNFLFMPYLTAEQIFVLFWG